MSKYRYTELVDEKDGNVACEPDIALHKTACCTTFCNFFESDEQIC